jgi:hypothetical protein
MLKLLRLLRMRSFLTILQEVRPGRGTTILGGRPLYFTFLWSPGGADATMIAPHAVL